MHAAKSRHPFGNRFRSAYSLRTRYLAVTLLVALIIMAGTLLAQSYVERAGELRGHNLKLRNEASLLLRQLRGAMLDVERDLNSFLRQPGVKAQFRVDEALAHALTLQKQLYELEWFKSSKMAAELDDFASDMQGLQMTVDHLMQNRNHPESRSAYLTLQRNQFQPSTQRFNKAIAASLQQLELHESAGLRNALHPSLETLRDEWLHIENAIEDYGRMDGERPPSAETFEQLEVRHKLLLISLGSIEKKLASAPANSPLHREWRRIRADAAQWHEGFEKMAELVHDGQSRGGAPVLATAIEQQFAHIWDYLQILDAKLENLSISDTASLTDITDTTARALWVLALFGISLLAAGAVYFERSILSPITQVARALLAESQGEPHPPLPDAQSRETHHLIEAFNEMHQQVQQRQQSLEHLALHDSLTGLANREQLVRTLERTLSAPEKSQRALALLLIGLNRFKEINNSLGHSVGDQLLIAVAQRLEAYRLGNSQVARLNGDGFALLLMGNRSAEADALASEIIKVLEAPFEVENQSLYLSATIGIAFSPAHGDRPLDLLQKAEVAMQVAKQQKIHLTHYSSEHDRHAMRRLALANALRQELRGPKEALSLVYQPQIEMRSGQVYGMEALLRWNLPRVGRVTPDELISIAEQTGLIYQLTPWVMERAFQEYSALKISDGAKPMLAVNLSALNLHEADFIRKLGHLMEKWAIDPALLQFEITESAMMADPASAHRTLDQIHTLGIGLIIDDFGTGFSSLTYLKQLPVNKLKIDKSFVISMLQDENDAVIIRSTIDMAHNLGMKVVAEGVENQETYDLLEILDCDIVQGYLISPAQELSSLEQWIQRQQEVAPRHTSRHAGCYPR